LNNAPRYPRAVVSVERAVIGNLLSMELYRSSFSDHNRGLMKVVSGKG